MGHHDALLDRLHQSDEPALVLVGENRFTLRRLARTYGLFETVGSRRYFPRDENVARLALAEQLRRAGLPYRQHAGTLAPITPELTAAFRTEALRVTCGIICLFLQHYLALPRANFPATVYHASEGFRCFRPLPRCTITAPCRGNNNGATAFLAGYDHRRCRYATT